MKCADCGKDTTPIVYFQTLIPRCFKCFKRHQEIKTALIDTLPDISESKPPFGCHQVGFDYYHDELKAQSFSNYAYHTHCGMRN